VIWPDPILRTLERHRDEKSLAQAFAEILIAQNREIARLQLENEELRQRAIDVVKHAIIE